jgi:hypothetical protein
MDFLRLGGAMQEAYASAKNAGGISDIGFAFIRAKFELNSSLWTGGGHSADN